MTRPIAPPPRKDPQKRTRLLIAPPELRSRAALGLSAAAAEGAFRLQHCAACGAVQYPARDVCGQCLSPDLNWRDTDPAGTILAETTVRVSTHNYYRERAPWRMGSVQLDAGPVVLCHLHGDCKARGRVRIIARLDRAGQGVLIALPEEEVPHMSDDPVLRELSADPKHRRILITDARAPQTPALIAALRDAGAAHIFLGLSEGWRPDPAITQLGAAEDVDLLPLDVTDAASVRTLAAEIGGKTDILINTARFLRPGGVLARGDTGLARDEMEVNYLGLMRLAQSFGPALCARSADGTNAAAAWVNLLSVGALSNMPEYGAFCASQAAARSLSQSMRAEFRSAGVRVMNVYSGPTDDDWFQTVPPPKVAPSALARAVISGLQQGLEDVWCGDIAQDIREKFRRDPKVLERELTYGGGA